MARALIGLALAASALHAADAREPDRKNSLHGVQDVLELSIPVGPQALFGISMDCALDGSAAEVKLRANKDSPSFPLWSGHWDEKVDLEFVSGGRTLRMEGADTLLDSFLELERPFDLFDFLLAAGSVLDVTITNSEGVRHTESFRSKSWLALAVLCGAGTDIPAAVEAAVETESTDRDHSLSEAQELEETRKGICRFIGAINAMEKAREGGVLDFEAAFDRCLGAGTSTGR